MKALRIQCNQLPRAAVPERRTLVYVALLLMLMISCAGPTVAAAATELDDAMFKQLVADLNNKAFGVRQRATNLLKDYVDPKSDTQLKVTQLQALRTLALNKDAALEERVRAGDVLRQWAQVNPNTVAPMRQLIESIQFKEQQYLRFLDEVLFTLDSFEVHIFGSNTGFPAAKKLESKYNEVLNQLNAGFPDQALQAIQDMKKVLSDLPEAKWNALTLPDRKDTTRAAVLKKLDDAAESAAALLKKINMALGDPPPGAAPKVPVPGSGMADTGLTFGLALNGSVTPGNLTFVSLPQAFALGSPPPGFQFFGPIFILTADDILDLLDGSIQVSIEYGDPALAGFPTSLAPQFQLTRLANGIYETFDTTLNDVNAFIFSGSYVPHSDSGLDQFGEFAIVMPVPEPGSWLLFVLGLGVLASLGIPWPYARARIVTRFPQLLQVGSNDRVAYNIGTHTRRTRPLTITSASITSTP